MGAVNPEKPTQTINAMFECVSGCLTGTTTVPVRRVEINDDGSLMVVLDYWPKEAPFAQPTPNNGSDEIPWEAVSVLLAIALMGGVVIGALAF